MQFEVTEVVSAVTYWARMMGREEDKAAARRRLRMAVYYRGEDATREERVGVGREVAVVRGEVCRGLVTRVESEEEHTVVTVLLVDSGEEVVVAPRHLLHLPPHLHTAVLPPGVRRVTVAGLRPAEGELEWGVECNKEVGGGVHLYASTL